MSALSSAPAADSGPAARIDHVDGHAETTPPTPLWVVLAFAFVNSLGSGVVSNGIFFMTDAFFKFSKGENFALGVVYGLAYVPGALLIGPLLKRLPRSHAVLNTRSAIGAALVGMGACCWLPWAAGVATGREVPPAWTVWVLMFVYSGLSGMLWPMVESYISGGRTGHRLRGAIGKFNIAWSSALVLALLVLGPLAEKYAVAALQGLGALHALSAVLLAGFPRKPAGHAHEHHAAHPAVYEELLALFKWLLPMAYMVLAALSPYLPVARESLGLSSAAGVWLAAVWTAARVITFVVAERWHGWHGQRWMPRLGSGLLLGGFAVIVLAPPFLPPAVAFPLFLAGLATFGVGIGAIYTATLYYTMAVGAAEVEAGGTFEALIGSGYVLGPLCGLAAVGLVQTGAIAPRGLEPAMLAMVGLLAALATTLAIRQALRQRSAPAHGMRR